MKNPNTRLFLIALVALIIARLGIIAATRSESGYWDHPTVPMFVGLACSLVFRQTPRSLAGLGLAIVVTLLVVTLTEAMVAMIVTSVMPGSPITVRMLAYWAAQPAYLLFAVAGVLLVIPLYWLRENNAASAQR